MVCSMRLMVTLPPVCSSAIDSTQAASHGAGHNRPVNSGKLLVACNRSLAASHRPRRTRSFHSGIRLPSGQPAVPEWQNGIPQSMQRRGLLAHLGGPRMRVPAPRRPHASRRRVRRRAACGPRPWSPEEIPAGQPRVASMIAASTSRGSSALAIRVQHLLVVGRHDLGELRTAPRASPPAPMPPPCCPVNAHGARRSRAATPGPRFEALQLHHRRVHLLWVQAKYVRDTAGHARCDVAPGRAETTTRPLVMYSQAWSPTPSVTASAPELRAQKRSPTRPRRYPRRTSRRTSGVPGNDVVLGRNSTSSGGRTTIRPPESPFADIVVGVADQVDGYARRQERTQ